MDQTIEERIESLIKRRLPISDKDQRALWQAYQKAKARPAARHERGVDERHETNPRS